ncbi:MAG: hypothetical protein KF739_00500 [Cryobacterium sp.]|nr:hypothetical protein [Cryobacterium sp.]HNP16709.1 hypothetical protein [Terrimesophilobacter sp.]
MHTPTGKPDRTLLVIVSVIAAVVVLALIVVFTRGAPAALDPSTPQGVVQSYSQAVIAGDRTTAMDLLTATVREKCDRADPYPTTSQRVTLVSTTVTGHNAVVQVSISSNSGGGPFGGSEYQSEGRFTLVSEGGSWRIDSAPWEFTICYNQGGNE